MRRAELEARWYEERPPPLFLRPVSRVFAALASLRRWLYRYGVLRSRHPGCPVVVVGNITAGGTGKTPLVIWLAGLLQDRGWRPGVVSRGYGGKRRRGAVLLVDSDTDPAIAGDEPVLIARRTSLPVAVHPRRTTAARYLVEHIGVNVVISDDGLQHYALARDMEICVLDGERRVGNGWPMPAGPLREPASRLRRVDFVVANGRAAAGEHAMSLLPGDAAALANNATRPLREFAGSRVHGVAGIGNPARFFRMLEEAGLRVVRHPFPDHHAFQPGELEFGDDAPVLMTEKDAVRLGGSTLAGAWRVPVRAELPDAFREQIVAALEELRSPAAETPG